jgi:hypothetical protein
MMRVTRRTRIGTISMAAALLSLGAGVALLGASCNSYCPPEGCWDPADATCPWRCTQYPWDGTKYSIDGFRFWSPLVVWIGDPRDAPDRLSVNYYQVWDFYQDPKSLDRCPRCVAEPLEHDHFDRVVLRKGGPCNPRSISAAYSVEHFAPCEIVGGEQEGEITPGPLVSFCCTPVGGTF